MLRWSAARGTRKRFTIGVTTAAVLACSALAFGPKVAGAAQPRSLEVFVAEDLRVTLTEARKRLSTLDRASKLAARIRKTRRSWFAGSWVDPTSLKQVVAVVGSPGVESARSFLAGRPGGADIELVPRSSSIRTIEKVRSQLVSRAKRLPRGGPKLMAWFDEQAGTLRIQTASQVPQSRIADLRSAADGTGVPVSLESLPDVAARLKPLKCAPPNCDRPLRTGVGVGVGTSSTCSAGFFARSSGYRYLITAGHCGSDYKKAVLWYAKSPSYHNHETGSRSWDIGKHLPNMTSFGPWDYMAIRKNKDSFWWADDPGGFFDDRRKTNKLGYYVSSRMPQVGEPACRIGITSGYACGTVTATNISTYVGSVPVSGLFSTDSCATAGDSGGPYLTTGGVLLGLLSGGAIDCKGPPGQSHTGYTVASQSETVLDLLNLALLAGS